MNMMCTMTRISFVAQRAAGPGDGSKLARSNWSWMSGRMPISVGIATFRRAGMRRLERTIVPIFIVSEIRAMDRSQANYIRK